MINYIYNPDNLEIEIYRDEIIINGEKLSICDNVNRDVYLNDNFVFKMDNIHSEYGHQCEEEYKFFLHIKNNEPKKLKRLAKIFAFGQYNNLYWLVQKKLFEGDFSSKYARKIANELRLCDQNDPQCAKRKNMIVFYDYAYNFLNPF